MYPYFCNKNETTNNLEYTQNLNNENDYNSQKHFNEIKQNIKTTDFDNEEDFRQYVIDALKEAIKEQDENAKYYEKLYNMAQDEKEKDIIRQIYLNELKYKKIFMEIYKMITGEDANIQESKVDIDGSFIEELYDSIEEQLEDLEFYRMLMSVFADLPIRDMIYEVIVGKQKHAQQLSNIYNKYR